MFPVSCNTLHWSLVLNRDQCIIRDRKHFIFEIVVVVVNLDSSFQRNVSWCARLGIAL